MDIELVTLVMSAFFAASFLKGVTGLGFSTICLPILSFYIEPGVAISLVIIPSLLSNFIVMRQSGRFTQTLKRFWKVYLSALPGLFIGVYLLSSLESAVSRTVLGVVLTLYSVGALFNSGNNNLSDRLASLLLVPVGLITGLINGLTGSQIMPVLPYMLSLKLDKDTFVQAVNQSFTFSSLVMLLLLSKYEFITTSSLVISISGAIFVFLGVWAGGYVRDFLPIKMYKQIVLIMLLVTGVILVAANR